ncbi:peptidoglycan editing factor PgeF [Paenibacillus sp. CECT 9249]|uniref:peptidoglycan editing factor PgeF n=1 Tax=unclassified Paenibacillus TaxID=185978 RepID=UPI001EF9BBD2|nr:Polyphenol oxidase [Paenibacillus sp. CECT 9249]
MMEPFVLREKADAPALFYLESWMKRVDGLSAGFSSRLGGVGSGAWSSLNCALHVNDRPEDVIENRKRIAATLSFSFENWTCAEQIHGNRVYIVGESDRGSGRESRETAIQNADALVTNVPDVWLTSFYADCVPLYFVDPVKRVVGLAHAGWRGTVAEIAKATVETMRHTYDSDPKDILASIGPSIGLCCYEVDERVMEHVKPFAANLGDALAMEEPFYTDCGNGKSMLNLKQLNRQMLRKAGILPTNIEYSTWCTSCHGDYFFSHRRDHGKTGRMISWIGLEKR